MCRDTSCAYQAGLLGVPDVFGDLPDTTRERMALTVGNVTWSNLKRKASSPLFRLLSFYPMCSSCWWAPGWMILYNISVPSRLLTLLLQVGSVTRSCRLLPARLCLCSSLAARGFRPERRRGHAGGLHTGHHPRRRTTRGGRRCGVYAESTEPDSSRRVSLARCHYLKASPAGAAKGTDRVYSCASWVINSSSYAPYLKQKGV